MTSPTYECCDAAADRERRRIRRAVRAAMENLRHIVWCKGCDSRTKLGEAIAKLDAATRKPRK